MRLGMGAMGELVREIQQALIASGFDLKADRIYGQGTCDAVKQFQSQNSLTASGAVEEETWQALLRRPLPAVGERCLQLTAAFEGHGFEFAVGNFDGAMLTWGIVGFTLKSGEVQKIVGAIEKTHPGLVEQAFGAQREELLGLMNATPDFQKQWATAHTLRNGALAEPWRTMFAHFGSMADVQAEQMQRARRDYLQPALVTAKKLGFTSELGLALSFDIHVQNGGIRASTWKGIERQSHAGMSELERRTLVANVIAESQRAVWKEDVRSRKLTIATGEGEVHGHRYVLENWGLSECGAGELSQASLMLLSTADVN
jgi:hypothetical protein